MQNVFFNLRTSSRERMWDTARQAKAVCTPLTPDLPQRTTVARAVQKKRGATLRGTLKEWVKRGLPLLNYQRVPAPSHADLAYVWGAFPRDLDIPYVIELDNPYVLSYYDTHTFTRRRRHINRQLSRAHAITFLSAASRNHTLELLGDSLSERCHVLYPYMTDNTHTHQPSADGLVRFLFVGIGFRRKGGPELLKAFNALSNPNIRLTVVSEVPEAVIAAYAHDPRITFMPPQERSVLFTEIYPNHDVFVLPTLLESLGVVVLEALSFGLGVITTDVYATPEMVHNGVNGVLMPHPFLEHTNLNGTPTIDCVTLNRTEFDEQYVHTVPLYDNLVSEVASALNRAIPQAPVWRTASQAHFTTTFAPAAWERSLANIIKQ